jgi:hypothetical protein
VAVYEPASLTARRNHAEWDFQGSAVACVRAARNNRNAMLSRSVVVSVRYLIGASESSTCSRNAHLFAQYVEFLLISISTLREVLYLRGVGCIDVSM